MSEERSDPPHGEVWLSDLLHGLAHTKAGDDESSVQWAVELLDLDPCIAKPESPAGHAASSDITPIEPGDASKSPGTTLRHAPTPLPGEMPDRPVPYEVVRTHYASRTGALPHWYESAGELEELDEAQFELRPEFQPLFLPGTMRALIATAFATPNGEGEIDLDLIIERIARQQPLVVLPRTRHSTMRLGIQLLIDRGDGMLPFSADQELLCGAIHEVVGQDRVETLYFDDSPLRKMNEGDRFGRQFAYEPPTPRTPVIMLTDLGLAGRRSTAFGASTAEWLEFAKIVRGAGCPLLALTPYGSKRTPRRLRKTMYILPWDRITNVSLVRRTVGLGLELASWS